MAKQVVCDAENFAIGMDELLSDIAPDVAKKISVEIPKVARSGAKTLREEAGKRWKGKTGKRYSSGFQARKIQDGIVTTAEIGNKNVPGLVHLLEKGHETLTSRRVAGIPHVAPVYNELEPKVLKAISDAVGEALEG